MILISTNCIYITIMYILNMYFYKQIEDEVDWGGIKMSHKTIKNYRIPNQKSSH